MAAPQFTLTTPTGIGAIVGDPDHDGDLDSSMYAGAKVTFTPNTPRGLLVPIPGEGLRAIDPVTVTLDVDGKINGDTGVPLLADDPGLGLDKPLQWQVSVAGWAQSGVRPLRIDPWWINARPEGETLDLRLAPPVAKTTAHPAAGDGLSEAEFVALVENPASDLREALQGIGIGGSGANLSTTRTSTQVVVVSDSGADATIPAADASNAGVMTAAQQSKLAGITTGATANSPDAALVSRANHTGTQLSSTISDFSSAADARVSAGITGKLDTSAAPELIRDTMAAALVQGTNITITPNDAADTITISATGEGIFEDVTAHGATGNGSTDDTTAIAAAITAAGVGGVIFFPAGTYLLNGSSGLTPLSGQTWFGPGQIKLGASKTFVMVDATSISNVTMAGLTFDGNRANQSAEAFAMVRLVTASNCLIDNCTFQNAFGTTDYVGTPAVQLRMPQNCTVRSCDFYNVGYGVQLGAIASDAVAMYGNSVIDCTFSATDWNGVFLTENLGSQADTPVGYLRGTTVDNCRFQLVGDVAVEVGSGSVGTTVSNCSMDNAANPSIGNNAFIIRDAVDTVITGCSMRNYLKSAARAIYLLDLNGTNRGVTVTGCTIDNVDIGIVDASGAVGVSVTGCIINDHSQTSSGSFGLGLVGTTNFAVTGCTISNGSGTPGSNEGLVVYGASDGVVTGCVVAGNAGNDGMIILGESHGIIVTGNRFADNTFGLRIYDEDSHNITVVSNDFRGNSVEGFSSNGNDGLIVRSNAGFSDIGGGGGGWSLTLNGDGFWEII